MVAFFNVISSTMVCGRAVALASDASIFGLMSYFASFSADSAEALASRQGKVRHAIAWKAPLFNYIMGA